MEGGGDRGRGELLLLLVLRVDSSGSENEGKRGRGGEGEERAENDASAHGAKTKRRETWDDLIDAGHTVWESCRQAAHEAVKYCLPLLPLLSPLMLSLPPSSMQPCLL